MTLETDSSSSPHQQPEKGASIPPRIILQSDDDSIVLKQLILDDAEDYFRLVDSDRGHLSQHGDNTAKKYTSVDSVRASILKPNDRKFRFGIWDEGKMVGSVNLTLLDDGSAESGSWIGAEHTGHNYAARARDMLIDFAFNTLGLDKIISKIVVGNEPSRKSVEKSGYVFQEIIDEDGVQEWLYVLKNPRAGSK